MSKKLYRNASFNVIRLYVTAPFSYLLVLHVTTVIRDMEMPDVYAARDVPETADAVPTHIQSAIDTEFDEHQRGVVFGGLTE